MADRKGVRIGSGYWACEGDAARQQMKYDRQNGGGANTRPHEAERAPQFEHGKYLARSIPLRAPALKGQPLRA
jgi:hypothetical protein